MIFFFCNHLHILIANVYILILIIICNFHGGQHFTGIILISSKRVILSLTPHYQQMSIYPFFSVLHQQLSLNACSFKFEYTVNAKIKLSCLCYDIDYKSRNSLPRNTESLSDQIYVPTVWNE